MRAGDVFVAVLLVTACAAMAAEGTPDWQLKARKEFGERRFGIFVHWGLYSVYSQGEWYQSKGVSRTDYAQAKNMFYPSLFDARKWAKAFKSSGAKYVTFTTRHHDGFSMFGTKYAQGGYDILHTPFKRDVTREIAEACRAEGLQVNFYYSLMDWWRTDYPLGRSAKYIIDGEFNAKADYASYHRFMLNQIEELLTNYGRIGCIWLDGEGDHRESEGTGIPDGGWRLDELYDLIHSHGAIVGNNNARPVREKEDIQFFEMEGTAQDGGRHAERMGKPRERCQTIQGGDKWAYTLPSMKRRGADGRIEMDSAFFSPEEMVRALAKNAGRGVNLLLNVGPRGDGELPDEAKGILSAMGRWLAVNGEAIYATEAGFAGDGKTVVSTKRGDALYILFLDPSVREFSFDCPDAVISAVALEGGGAVPFASADGRVTMKPSIPVGSVVWAVKVLLDERRCRAETGGRE